MSTVKQNWLQRFFLNFFAGGRTAWCSSFTLVLLVSSALSIFLNMKMLNSVIMRDREVVEQPIRLHHNLTQRLINESVHFLEARARDSVPFLLMVSWVQVGCEQHSPMRVIDL